MTGILHHDHHPAATSEAASSTPSAATPALTPPDRPVPFPAVGASPASANGAAETAPAAIPITPDMIDRAALLRRFWRKQEMVPLAMAAKELGMRAEDLRLRALRGIGPVPIFSVNRRLLVERSDLDAALARREAA